MTFITQHPLHRNVKQEKLSFSINGGMPNYNGGVRATTESRLSVFLSWLTDLANPLSSNLTSTWQQYKYLYKRGSMSFPRKLKLVVSNHHSKCLSKGKFTMMEICSKSDADPFCRQPLNGDLISSLCESTIFSSSLSSLMPGSRLGFSRKNERVVPLLP
jgi:hypothetical protein